jgi:trimethylamine:corrinoid methyltransferase-like protein
MSAVEHKLEYLAGISGFGQSDGVPHWYCTCGAWRINRDLRTGSPMRETAERKPRKHMNETAGSAGAEGSNR